MKNISIIKKNQDFQKIIRHRKFKNTSSFVVYFINKNEGSFRYGISVGKKLGNAVLRNHTKRIVRTIVYNSLEKLKFKKIDVVIIVKAGFLNKEYADNSNQLDKLLLSI
ncbi:ribonuclease P (protein C5) [Spiroplasma corruscae]|uniref:Ribonuclease P protein component n=1 Tax=Spiroplasma corruscae TaxID=216934 RepID=A0A222EQJ3_9MOLU|nr:ribonuclease P protein component [Spiroplasma corruscae]ASP28782.1 ribonuclease P (protein C5) [Spiroplasma corruscae]